MTNAEKYKTIEERSKAFNELCTSSESCERCPIRSPLGSGLHCAFTWLEKDTQLSADEVSNILIDYLIDYIDATGDRTSALNTAIIRAIGLLKEKNND